MDPQAVLREYECKLGEQSWAAVADLIHEEAVFIFSEGTFRGKAQIGEAFTRTFQTIQDETYSISDVEWLATGKEFAACIYSYAWSGVVNGRRLEGGGRGTTLLCKTETGWQILHEHLGPPART